jgi:hypothetical protein
MSLGLGFANAVAQGTFAVRVVEFKEVSELPSIVSAEYQELVRDVSAADGEKPRFSVSYEKLRPGAPDGIFVRVNSSLTCSARGECQIDLFALENGGAKRIFSIVAANIGIFSAEKGADASDVYPGLLTNIPDNAPLSATSLKFLRFGALWQWTPAGYKAKAANARAPVSPARKPI